MNKITQEFQLSNNSAIEKRLLIVKKPHQLMNRPGEPGHASGHHVNPICERAAQDTGSVPLKISYICSSNHRALHTSRI